MATTDRVHDQEPKNSFAALPENDAITECDRPRANETILLVEDDAFVRTVVSQVLESAGFQIIPARDPAEALGLVRNRYDISLLIADVILPGMNGRELATQFEILFPRAKVLMISGYAQPFSKTGETSAKENYLAKPFSARTLLMRVREVLRLRGAKILH